MNNRAGIIGIFFGIFAAFLLVVSLESYSVDDGINMKFAPVIAEFVALLVGNRKSETAFKPASITDITEQKIIFFIGGVAITFGLVALVLGFFSIRDGGHPGISYGAVALGNGPLILLSIELGLVSLCVTGFGALMWCKLLTRRP